MQQPQLQVESLINNPTAYVQASAGVWPNDFKFRDQLSIPLTLSLRPIELDDDIRSASFPNNKINQYRCHSCKAFINKYCTIRSKFQYDCSICGCTNRLFQQIDSLAVEMVAPVYTCMSISPQHRINQGKIRTIAFLIDLTQYRKETDCILKYVVQILRDFIKQVEDQQVENQQEVINNKNNSSQKCKIQALILGFDYRIHQYRIISDNPEMQQQQIHKNGKQEQKGIDPNGQEHKQKYYIEKLVDTHLSNNYEDIFLYDNKQTYFIQIPKHKQLVEQILSDMISEVNSQNVNQSSETSSALLAAIQRVYNYTGGCVGKIFVVTGYRQEENQFINSIQQQSEQSKSNFTVNKQKCLSPILLYLIQKTQMSISFFIYNNAFINIMPIFALSKLTNGQLRLYNPNQFQQFYYQFHYAVCTQYFQLGTQAILKVRHSSGVKLVGIFGQYRNYKGGTDQIQLLSCPDGRIYVFQFNIEGKVQQPYLNIQFSILWTDQKGQRIFKVLTYCQKLSNNRQQILDSINYGIVNQSYLWAIIYNMDLNTKIKTLQLTLQERCRKHIKAIQKFNQSKINIVKRATPYIMFTYYLMRHFIMNTRYTPSIIYDKSIQTRSRIITGDISGIHTVWPAVYKIGTQENQVKIVEMRYEQIKDTKLAVVIDQGDYCHVHILSPKLRKQVNHQKLNSHKQIFDIIDQKPELKSLASFLRQIRQEKFIGYVQIVLMESLQGICILDEKGPLSYSNFVNIITS